MPVVLQTANIVSGATAPATGSPSISDIPVTISAGSNLALFVLIQFNGSNFAVQWQAPTFNGVALTFIGAQTALANNFTAAYVMVNPPVGTYNLRISNSAYTGAVFPYAAFPCSGVDQTTPYGTPAFYSTGSSASPRSTAVTTAAGGIAIAGHGVYVSSGSSGLAVTAPQTLVGAIQNSGSQRQYAISYLADATSMGYSWTSGNNQNHQYIVPINPAPSLPDLSGSMTLAGITAGGGMVSVASSLTGTVDLAGITAAGGMGAPPGVITSPVLKNNTGTILASVTGIVANVYNPTTGALVVRKTGLTSSAGGVVTITDMLLVQGTTYAYELDLSATSQGRRLPVGTAV